MATALAEAGADVAITARTLASCADAASAIASATGRRCQGFAADVTAIADVERLANDVEAAFGQVDILVNNAGTNIRGQVDQLSEADWDAVIDTNLKGPFLCARAIGPRMVKRGWGRVINLGSTLSVIALPGRAPYCSSKAGVLNLSRVLALEWAGTGVTVNTICPGPFGTEMNRPLLDDPGQVQGADGPDSDGPVGRSRRDRRRGGLPRVARVVLHHRQRGVRGRRLDGAVDSRRRQEDKGQRVRGTKDIVFAITETFRDS